jgi:hypothetical protein
MRFSNSPTELSISLGTQKHQTQMRENAPNVKKPGQKNWREREREIHTISTRCRTPE